MRITALSNEMKLSFPLHGKKQFQTAEIHITRELNEMMCVKYLAHRSLSGWADFFSSSDISHVVCQKFEGGVLGPKCRNPSMQCLIH